LTGLPLIPASAAHPFGNQPTEMPSSTICKSKFQGNSYHSVVAKVDATVALVQRAPSRL
jgi:hypothetical protein